MKKLILTFIGLFAFTSFVFGAPQRTILVDNTSNEKSVAVNEDAAHVSGEPGFSSLTVRKNTAAALSGTDGDYQPLITDTNGRLHVIDVNSTASSTSLALIDDALYVDDADWTGDESKHVLVGGVFGSNTVTSGDVGPLLINDKGSLSSFISAPQDTDWATHVSDATAATTDPYDPAGATGITEISMDGFTGVQVRVKYVDSANLTTDPVVACFGRKGTDWATLRDADGTEAITLADQANDINDDTNEWTDTSEKIDALGAEAVKCTIPTAAVSSSGAVSLEISRY